MFLGNKCSWEIFSTNFHFLDIVRELRTKTKLYRKFPLFTILWTPEQSFWGASIRRFAWPQPQKWEQTKERSTDQ